MAKKRNKNIVSKMLAAARDYLQAEDATHSELVRIWRLERSIEKRKAKDLERDLRAARDGLNQLNCHERAIILFIFGLFLGWLL